MDIAMLHTKGLASRKAERRDHTGARASDARLTGNALPLTLGASCAKKNGRDN